MSGPGSIVWLVGLAAGLAFVQRSGAKIDASAVVENQVLKARTTGPISEASPAPTVLDIRRLINTPEEEKGAFGNFEQGGAGEIASMGRQQEADRARWQGGEKFRGTGMLIPTSMTAW